MALRKIRTEEDEVLRKKSKVVKTLDERTRVLIEDMLDTMYTANGVGLAAPQVGILKRIIVIDIGEGPITLINPEILEMEGKVIDVEGCLSVPGEQGNVVRPEYVKVRGLDKNWIPVEIEAHEFLARAFCHEIDHLEGILYTDKIVRGGK